METKLINGRDYFVARVEMSWFERNYYNGEPYPSRAQYRLLEWVRRNFGDGGRNWMWGHHNGGFAMFFLDTETILRFRLSLPDTLPEDYDEQDSELYG